MTPYEKSCDECGCWVSINAKQITIVRWWGSVLKPGWWVHGACPVCGWLTVEHQVADPDDAHDWLEAGARACVFQRPAELDDWDWHQLGPVHSKKLARDLAEALIAADWPSIGDELAALVEVYGS